MARWSFAATRIGFAVTFAIACFLPAAVPSVARAEPASAAAVSDPMPIEYSEETLENGLRVIYAPLHQAPVVHTRVLYHVGSRDERPDRQGFAHMFEHMMFRGSAHVAPEEHMKLIGMVGGYCNAYTSFDETVYHNTLPSNQLPLALYLEADRMASFKVSENIYKTERRVVAQEWAMGQNRPYGTMFEDFLKNAFTTHSYRWTPIGNMQDLQAAQVNELQEFYNTYYLPNNAILVIAGDFETSAAKAMVRKYFGWIPRGPDVKRSIPIEPVQTQARRAVTPKFVPLPAVMIGYHVPAYASDDHYPLEILGTIMGDGRSSRLDRLLVNSQKPLCVNVTAGDETLEDGGIFLVRGTVMSGRSEAEVEKMLAGAVADVVEKGVTQDELDKAKTQLRVGIIKGRATAEDLASQLGAEALFAGNAGRVNTELAKLQAVTTAEVQAIARKYLRPDGSTTLLVKPDPFGRGARAAATAAAAVSDSPVTPATQPVVPRAVTFPKGYPTTPPVADIGSIPEFKKGVDVTVDGVSVVVMTDNRLPLVSATLAMRRGSHNEPNGKEGVAGLTAEMLRRGVAGESYAQMNNDLESRGITLNFGDVGDHTNLDIACTTEQIDHAFSKARAMLMSPTFPQDEFDKLKEQTINGLLQSQENGDTVAGRELSAAVWAGSILGRYPTPATVASITLDDVKDYYHKIYRPENAVLIFSGDVTAEKGKELAEGLLKDWTGAEAAEPDCAQKPIERRIILVDRPDAKQAAIRMALRAYDIHSNDKFAGSLATQIMTGGIDARLMKYVRAQLGLVYGISGDFRPGRQVGTFNVGTDCKIENTARTITAAFRVLDGMCSAPVAPAELTDAKLRAAGSMVMRMQTIQQQASMRLEGILNDYPVDYYDKLPARLAQISAEDIREVMDKYVDVQNMDIIVVAPASQVKEQLEKRFGPIEVIPMPAERGATTKPVSHELLKPA